ncbi:MAG: YkvA family protein [Xanthobacteraceae bacterium]
MWSWQQAASWQEFAALSRRMVANEQSLRRRFWRKMLREAASLPFAEQLLTAYYCAFDRNTPLYVKAVLVGAIVYFVVPDRFIPKYVSLIGFADNAAMLATAFKAVASHIKREHREAAQRTLARLCR